MKYNYTCKYTRIGWVVHSKNDYLNKCIGDDKTSWSYNILCKKMV